MPTFTGKTFASFYKNLFGINQSSNTGVDSTTRAVQDGAGNSTSISLSDDVLSVQPVNDDTTGTFVVKNKGGSNIFAIDTSGTGTGSTSKGRVLMGTSQVVANTQYTHFGVSYFDNTGAAAFSADTHYAIPFMRMNFGAVAGYMAMGSSTSSSFNDTEPATSLTISASAMDIINTYWYVMDDITIDRVVWWQGADTATGDSTAAYLMGYTADASSTSTGGDLSSGVKLASSSTITNAGYEQAYYNQMTIHSADVDARKVILFTFAADTINSDYSINATVKYHIR